MEREYIILCDESDQKGLFFSNFFGGVIVGGSVWQSVSKRLETAKAKAGIESEVKWSKVSPHDVDRYEPLIQEFFDLIAEGMVRMRVMFRQNIHQPVNLTQDHLKNEYFILYYQFLKHGFGLSHMPPHPSGVRLRFYLDQLPDQSKEKLAQFRGYISGLSSNPHIRRAGLSIGKEDITQVDSKDHILLQCADVVLGSISFRLNGKHKAIPAGKKRRGKRTLAKERLYKFILGQIKRVTGKDSFNIGITTGLTSGIEGRWTEAYLHWRFVPKDHVYDKYRGKRHKKSPI
jgi:hypothetical protein